MVVSVVVGAIVVVIAASQEREWVRVGSINRKAKRHFSSDTLKSLLFYWMFVLT